MSAGAQSVSGVCTCSGTYVPETKMATNCVPCYGTCATCSGSAYDQCLTCKSLGASTPPDGGECTCQNGYVPGTTAGSACELCYLSCVTCKVAGASGCLTCIAKGATAAVSATGGMCTCRGGFVPQQSPTTDCSLCDSHCETCSALGDTGCVTCKAAGATVPAAGSRCTCSSQYVPEVNSLSDCKPCHSSCATCINDDTENSCLTCIAEGATAPAGGGKCECRGGYVADPITLTCVKCHSSCGTCTTKNTDGCITCVAIGATAPSPNGLCKCSGEYIPVDSPIENCSRCAPPCATCNLAGEDHCLTCVALGAIAPVNGGNCACSGDYVPADNPTTECTPCSPPCSKCSALGMEYCLDCAAPGATVVLGHCTCSGKYVPAQDSVTACKSCHASCQTCGDENADTCKSCAAQGAVCSETGSLCKCDSGYVPSVSPTTTCVLCHESCKTCNGDGAAFCTECMIAEAEHADPNGICKCKAGYVSQDSPTTCTKCDPACAVCNGPTANDCVGVSDIAQFIVTSVGLNGNLPFTTQTNSLICFRFRKTAPSAEAHYASLLGNLNKDASGNWHLSSAQCSSMLSYDWDYVNYWLEKFFPSVVHPVDATPAQILSMQTVMRIWIFHFGSATLTYDRDWVALIGRINKTNIDWTKVLGWAGTSPGYYDGTTRYTFPAKLAAWLAIDTSDLTAFNSWSTICNVGSCGFKTECCATPQFVKSPCCEL